MKQQTLWSLKSLLSATVIVLSLVCTALAITINEYAIPTSNSSPFQIIAGPDRNLWFTEFAAGKIGHITTGGAITEYSLSTPFSNAGWITAGPEGNVWFTVDLPIRIHRIGRITMSGMITEFDLPNPGDSPYSLIAGKDGNLWYAVAGKKIGKISTSGSVTEYTLPVGVFNQI